MDDIPDELRQSDYEVAMTSQSQIGYYKMRWYKKDETKLQVTWRRSTKRCLGKRRHPLLKVFTTNIIIYKTGGELHK